MSRELEAGRLRFTARTEAIGDEEGEGKIELEGQRYQVIRGMALEGLGRRIIVHG